MEQEEAAAAAEARALEAPQEQQSRFSVEAGEMMQEDVLQKMKELVALHKAKLADYLAAQVYLLWLYLHSCLLWLYYLLWLLLTMAVLLTMADYISRRRTRRAAARSARGRSWRGCGRWCRLRCHGTALCTTSPTSTRWAACATRPSWRATAWTARTRRGKAGCSRRSTRSCARRTSRVPSPSSTPTSTAR